MARGKRSVPLDEQLKKVIQEIENLESTLKELKQTKKELEEQIHINHLSELDEMIKASGKSFDDVKKLLLK